ncbi:Uncharacterized protein dnl_51190 [Desulfonema limicola]|uniref:Uncharacterized protein n=1 Tax=Desulfonema limicola TaxID=45656 RepID=A0A975GIN2_9BACT|nr:hypothetical protein [Desulfonema limicola]QTA82737.1 Uncharacterized protein dnl_51190 [Desulfonema limicola]
MSKNNGANVVLIDLDDKKKLEENETLYDNNVMFIANAREQIEHYYKHGSIIDKKFIEFIKDEIFRFQEITVDLKDLNNDRFYSFCDHILISLQAIIEADRSLIDLSKKQLEDGFFNRLLSNATTEYSTINRRMNIFTKLIKKLQAREAKNIADINNNFKAIYQFIESIDKEYPEYFLDVLFGKIRKKQDEINDSQSQTQEQIQEQYHEIIEIIKGVRDSIDSNGIVKTFQPLIREIIETELDEKGKFIKLLTNKIIKISEEKDIELENDFQIIVDRIVGRGSQNNVNMARENTVLGLRQLSETDIDEILGNKIVKIVNKKSDFNDALTKIGSQINQLITFGGKNNVAMEFFYGFSLSIYYYNVIINGVAISNNFLSEDNKGDFFLKEFERLTDEYESRFENNPQIYASYTKLFRKTIFINGEMLLVHIFVKSIDSKRAYFFTDQEPTTFFKDQITEILQEKQEGDYFNTVRHRIQTIIDNYNLPKIEVTVYKSNGFELPFDIHNSVIVSRHGEKHLSSEFEEELSIIIDDIIKFYYKNNKSFFSRFIPRTQSYNNKKGCWYYWANMNKKKYLAIRMLEPLSKKDEAQFITHVTNNIWKNIINIQSISEIQEWVYSFISGERNGFIFGQFKIPKIVRFMYQSVIPIILLTLLIFIVKNDYSLLSNYKEQLDLKIKNISTELRNEIKEKALKDVLKIAKPQIELIKDCLSPFIFKDKEVSVEGLSTNDYLRLERIVDNLNLNTEKYRINIKLLKSADKKLNLQRAKSIGLFLHLNVETNIIITIDENVDDKVLGHGVYLQCQ